MGCECWNSVSLYGTAGEIERFRRLCIDLPPGSNPRDVRGGWDGYDAEIGFKGRVPTKCQRAWRFGAIVSASNYREDAPAPGSWSFSFDTTHYFPEYVFEELAFLSPKIHFDCECIDSLDDYMGFGWFNCPPGGEAFRQDMAVPDNFWTVGSGAKRKPDAHAKHMALLKALTPAAQQAERGLPAIQNPGWRAT